ncbi:quinone oxidoreductase family protein [Microbacterium sp.]|uniref:quinone oxidoreductase family protein n=1 Tax=Microbacterium sp. TaxID=51671 RepID=UPI003A8C37E7
MARVVTYTERGGPEVLSLTEAPTPPVGAGQLGIRVQAIGVNPIDAKLRAGIRHSPALTEPRRIGSDAAGIVTSVGDGVEGFRIGDAVVVAWAAGTYASELTIDAALATPRPPQVPAAEAAGIGIPVGTAYQTLRSLGVGSDDTLLVHGGSGAVGHALIQFARLWGARVLATTSDARADRVAALGAEPVAYGAGLADRVRALTDDVTVAIDAAGTDEALQTSRELVDDHARVATIVRGADADGLGIRAFGGGSPHPLTERERAWRAEAVPVAVALLAAGRFVVELGPQLPLADVVEAHRLLETGGHAKITLVP